MALKCQTAFFAATLDGQDVYVPAGAIFQGDEPVLEGREHLFAQYDGEAAIQLPHPSGVPAVVALEGEIVYQGESFYTLDRAAELLLELEAALAETPAEPKGATRTRKEKATDAAPVAE